MRWSRPSWSALAATLMAGLLLPAPSGAQGRGDDASDRPNYAAAAFDLAVVRPVGLAAVAVGAVFFVPAALLAAPGGKDPVREAWERFVEVPGKYVFTRPLGEF